MISFFIKLLKISTFTIAPAISGWYLVYIVHHHSIAPYWPSYINWIIFLLSVVITITGFVLDIREHCNSKSIRSHGSYSTRRLNTDRPSTGRRITDK